MARRSSVYELPPELREDLNARLVKHGFGSYSALTDWLAGQGYQISRSAVHRYGAALEQSYEAAMGDVQRARELARAYAADGDDDGLALTGAMTGMAQEALLRVLFAVRQMEDDPAEMGRQMSQISRALADLGRLSISHGKYAGEIKRAAAAELTERIEKSGLETVNAEQLRALIRDAYGA